MSDLNIIKAIQEKPTDSILNVEQLRAPSLRLIKGQGAHPWNFYPLQVLARSLRQSNLKVDIKSIDVRSEKVNLQLFADDMVLLIDNSKDSKPLVVWVRQEHFLHENLSTRAREEK
jgi:hypothetical protein